MDSLFFIYNKRIYDTFGSPFSENPTRKTDALNYQLPACYNKTMCNLNKSFFKKFPEETLFYIFYNIIDENY